MRTAAWTALWIAISATALAASDDQSMELPLEPSRQVRFVTDEVTWLSLDVSPDGQLLVLEILGDLYTLPITGGEATRLTSGMAFDSQPRFSPDGRRVAFVSDRSGAEAVWVMDTDGGHPNKLSGNGSRVEFASPAWAPDGSHVIVSRTSWGLGTFELWAYHVDGGKGLQITTARASPETAVGQRGNALGAVYSSDGRYLYYAGRRGGFGYNVDFPLWQIVRRDLGSGQEDTLTRAQGSAMRPLLSPDGRSLVYGTRYDQQTGLRIRDLETGADRWLVYPVQRDEQESRYTRDLLPGYAFTPDSESVIYAHRGRIKRVDVATGEITQIPFTAQVDQQLGPRLHFPYRLGIGPIKARLIRDPVLSPDGNRVAFSAFTRIYVHDFVNNSTRPLTPEGMQAFQPAWAPNGRQIAFVSWDADGGHIWKTSSNGRGRAQKLTARAAYYTDPVWTPDGKRIVALRAATYDRLYRESDMGAPVGSDLIWLPAAGGAARLIVPARGYSAPHFSAAADRILVYLGGGEFSRTAESSGLTALRFDGTDRRTLLTAKGPGIYFAEETVPASDIRLSPDGRHALIHHANQLYVAALLNRHLENVDVDIGEPSLPLARITDVGADFFGWRGDEIFWSAGNHLYRRPLASVEFDQRGVDEAESADGDSGDAAQRHGTVSAGGEPDDTAENHESVSAYPIDVYQPRYVPAGRLVLVGGTVLPMVEGAAPLLNAVVVIDGDRIAAVGRVGEVAIADDAQVVDLTGHTIVPGFIDTHAHFRPLRRVLDRRNWAFLANLAYGVTTGLDVQPSTTDILAYQDLIDAGLMVGPRALSTGPGIFSNHEFRSAGHAEAVLTRYRDHYRVHNLKAYIAGNRKQRQWIVQAARALQLMPTTEGALDMKLDVTHVIDGFSGNEHNFPVVDLYRDVVQLVAESGIAYTPTLVVSYGGPWAENYYFTRENPYGDAKLRRFVPHNALAARSLRGRWFHEDEFVFPELAAQAAKIVRAGGRVGVGSHGQLQGLGYHWELWALARGMTNLEVLTAATRHGAEIIGVARDIGTVEGGKLADLVVLRGDPLQDIRNTARIAYVIKNGELFDADTMDKLWPESVPMEPQWWWGSAPGGDG